MNKQLQVSLYYQANMASGWRIYCFWCILVLGMLSSGHCYVRIASIRSTSITTSFLPSRLTAFNPTTQHSRLYSASCSQTIVVAAPSKLTAWIFRLVPILRTIIHPTVAGGLLAGGLHAVTGNLNELITNFYRNFSSL